MKKSKALCCFFILYDSREKAWEHPLSQDFPGKIQHDFFGDIQTAIVQRSIVRLDTAMAVAGIEKDHISLSHHILPIPAKKAALSLLHKPDHVVSMEVFGKVLAGACQPIGLQAQLIVIYRCSYLFLHVQSPPWILPLYHRKLQKACKIFSFGYLHFR